MTRLSEDLEALKEAIRNWRPEDSARRTRTDLGKRPTAGEENEPDWLDGVKEIINYARISRSSFWRYVKRGFPAKKVVGTVVSKKSWIDAWKSEAPDLANLGGRGGKEEENRKE